MLQEAGHIKNTVVSVFWHIQCLHLMNSEVSWVLVSSRTQVQPQTILDPDYLPNYLSLSYDYGITEINNAQIDNPKDVKLIGMQQYLYWHLETYIYMLEVSYNHVQNILRFFDDGANFPFTKSETKRDY